MPYRPESGRGAYGFTPEGSPASVRAAAVPTPLGLLARVASRLGSLTPGIPTSWLWEGGFH
jgi:hypothetical protein